MKGTPEWPLVRRMLAEGSKTIHVNDPCQYFPDLRQAGDVELLRAFHEGGIPQVVSFPHPISYPLFDDWGRKRRW